MREELKKEIIRLLEEDNGGLLPDEAEREAEAIMYRKETYEQAKWNIMKIN